MYHPALYLTSSLEQRLKHLNQVTMFLSNIFLCALYDTVCE